MYRGADGRKCAIGWLIPDDKYESELELCTFASDEAKKVRTLLHAIDDELSIKDSETCNFLRRLQAIHDSMPVPEWEERLSLLSRAYNLSTQVIEEIA